MSGKLPKSTWVYNTFWWCCIVYRFLLLIYMSMFLWTLNTLDHIPPVLTTSKRTRIVQIRTLKNLFFFNFNYWELQWRLRLNKSQSQRQWRQYQTMRRPKTSDHENSLQSSASLGSFSIQQFSLNNTPSET